MVKNYIPLLFFNLFFHACVWSQDIQIFKVQDFDLKGNVKSCLVITDYGKESFEFNRDGLLVKTVTQYNDTDQDITYYKYNNNELLEKRMESYKNNILDASTSMANFYSVDSLPKKKVLEKIISYDKEFLEQQEYVYDAKGKLIKITTSNEDGVDETTVEYTPYKNELTTSFFINSVLEKSIRTSERKGKTGVQNVVLTKEYIDGEPNAAVEEVFNADKKLISKEFFRYSTIEKKFLQEKKLFYTYGEDGMLDKVTSKTATSQSVKEYIFQYDSNKEKNWIKQIVTPDNTYTTRRITYFSTDEKDG
ncbi:hypothetical protein LV716_17540 [Flagellimonas sp. HMM57]|uniref:hypothetical protein n=1 Tax=unclassified Flagellimonas TaxID=2644544 RepID=UPI0013D38BB7|nr:MULTISPECIES: hypothetical protein [unclassified Flagellimonas]UII76047.1 hypothetical protein LV716_17540 [Flagellimonas sp. HMM57]